MGGRQEGRVGGDTLKWCTTATASTTLWDEDVLCFGECQILFGMGVTSHVLVSVQRVENALVHSSLVHTVCDKTCKHTSNILQT